jgi:hypothetical protein
MDSLDKEQEEFGRVLVSINDEMIEPIKKTPDYTQPQ